MFQCTLDACKITSQLITPKQNLIITQQFRATKFFHVQDPHYDGWHLPIVPVPLLVNNYFIHRFTKYLLIEVSPVLASGVLMPASYRSCPREM